LEHDEFRYSWQKPGIQMTFDDAISFQKAKKIADEVIENCKNTVEDVIRDRIKIIKK